MENTQTILLDDVRTWRRIVPEWMPSWFLGAAQKAGTAQRSQKAARSLPDPMTTEKVFYPNSQSVENHDRKNHTHSSAMDEGEEGKAQERIYTCEEGNGGEKGEEYTRGEGNGEGKGEEYICEELDGGEEKAEKEEEGEGEKGAAKVVAPEVLQEEC